MGCHKAEKTNPHRRSLNPLGHFSTYMDDPLYSVRQDYPFKNSFKAVDMARQGNHKEALEASKEFCKHNTVYGLFEKHQALISWLWANETDDAVRREELLENTIESARRAVKRDPHSADYACFFAYCLCCLWRYPRQLWDAIDMCDRAKFMLQDYEGGEYLKDSLKSITELCLSQLEEVEQDFGSTSSEPGQQEQEEEKTILEETVAAEGTKRRSKNAKDSSEYSQGLKRRKTAAPGMASAGEHEANKAFTVSGLSQKHEASMTWIRASESNDAEKRNGLHENTIKSAKSAVKSDPNSAEYACFYAYCLCHLWKDPQQLCDAMDMCDKVKLMLHDSKDGAKLKSILKYITDSCLRQLDQESRSTPSEGTGCQELASLHKGKAILEQTVVEGTKRSEVQEGIKRQKTAGIGPGSEGIVTAGALTHTAEFYQEMEELLGVNAELYGVSQRASKYFPFASSSAETKGNLNA